MYDRILVPTDGSAAAEEAAATAFDLARTFGATVHVLYVIDESASKLLLSTKSMADTIADFSAVGEAATERIAATAEGTGVGVETAIVRGMGVYEAIVEYALEHDVDVIVMGTTGRQGIERVIGSTTERVIATSPVPVMAVSTADDDHSPVGEADRPPTGE